MSEISRVCPDCGTDRFAQRRLEHERQENATIRHAADRIARDNGRMRLELEKLRLERAELQSRLQRKIVRQSKAITRLEAKLREAGQKPYEGVGLAGAVGGADGEREEPDAVEKRRFA